MQALANNSAHDMFHLAGRMLAGVANHWELDGSGFGDIEFNPAEYSTLDHPQDRAYVPLRSLSYAKNAHLQILQFEGLRPSRPVLR